MALNLALGGYAYTNETTDTTVAGGWVIARFKVTDPSADRWIAGQTRSTGFARAWGIRISGGYIELYGYNGSHDANRLAPVEADKWYTVLVSKTKQPFTNAFGWVDDPETVKFSDNAFGDPGLTPDRFAIGAYWSGGAPVFTAGGASIAHVYFGTGELTLEQRTALFAGQDPRTVAGVNLFTGWTAVGNGAPIVEGRQPLTLSASGVSFDATDPLGQSGGTAHDLTVSDTHISTRIDAASVAQQSTLSPAKVLARAALNPVEIEVVRNVMPSSLRGTAVLDHASVTQAVSIELSDLAGRSKIESTAIDADVEPIQINSLSARVRLDAVKVTQRASLAPDQVTTVCGIDQVGVQQLATVEPGDVATKAHADACTVSQTVSVVPNDQALIPILRVLNLTQLVAIEPEKLWAHFQLDPVVVYDNAPAFNPGRITFRSRTRRGSVVSKTSVIIPRNVA